MINFHLDIILKNDLVILEPLNENHIIDLNLVSQKNPNLLHYSPSPFGTEEKLKKYIINAIEDRTILKRYAFAILNNKTKQYVGSTSYGNISNRDKRLEIGWTWLDSQFHGSHLNKNIKYLMIKYAFETLGAEKIEFRTDSRNIASIKALKKIGVSLEGELRSHTLMNDGFRRNTLCFGIIKEEWSKIQEIFFSDFIDMK